MKTFNNHLSVNVSDKMKDRIAEIAMNESNETGRLVSISTIIREAISEYIKRWEVDE